MAEVDHAPLAYRVPVEVWWWVEQRSEGLLHRRAARRDDGTGDPYESNPPLVDWVACLAYRRRKRAERRALAGMDDPPRVYRDMADWWVGYFRGGRHHYVCPLPTVVIRWRRA